MLFAEILSYGEKIYTISTNQENFNLETFLTTSEFQSPISKKIIIESNVVIGSTSYTTPAFKIPTGCGSAITIINYGKIYGAKGLGSVFNTSDATDGGDAFLVESGNVRIINESTGHIYGGGGGGGAGLKGADGINATASNEKVISSLTANNSKIQTFRDFIGGLGGNGGNGGDGAGYDSSDIVDYLSDRQLGAEGADGADATPNDFTRQVKYTANGEYDKVGLTSLYIPRVVYDTAAQINSSTTSVVIDATTSNNINSFLDALYIGSGFKNILMKLRACKISNANIAYAVSSTLTIDGPQNVEGFRQSGDGFVNTLTISSSQTTVFDPNQASVVNTLNTSANGPSEPTDANYITFTQKNSSSITRTLSFNDSVTDGSPSGCDGSAGSNGGNGGEMGSNGNNGGNGGNGGAGGAAGKSVSVTGGTFQLLQNNGDIKGSYS
jgi:hypothetical protein